MNSRPSRGRFLALGLLLVLAGLGWLGVVRPVADTFTRQIADVERTERILDGLKRIVEERPALERRLQTLDEARTSLNLTMAAESDGVAAAALQRLLKSAVDRAGGTLQSTQVKLARPDGSFRRIGLRVQFTGTIEALRSTLAALEAAHPVVYGDELEVRARQQMRSTGTGAVEDRTLEIRLDVYSLAQVSS